MAHDSVRVHIDGASRGNPGPAAFAFVIAPPEEAAIEAYGTMGETTNNIAEYTALLRALERAAELSLSHLHIHSDSELLVKQMNGEYRVKNADLKDLYDQAQTLMRQFDSVRFTHVRREQNKRADELCNIALDASKPRPTPAAKKDAGSVGEKALREDCIACLEASRQSWLRNDTNAPTAEQVWDQLWSLLVEEGAVAKKKSKK